jgi:3-oxoacyl-(acyl-carrier-protein) synthase
MSRIFVTGLGIVSPLGFTAQENRFALAESKCALGPMEFTSSHYAHKIPFGEVKCSNETLLDKFKITEKGVTRTTLLALEAFTQAVADAQLGNDELKASSTAFVIGTTVGGMRASDYLYQDAYTHQTASVYVNSYDLASVAIFIQKKYGLKGIVSTFNTACTSSANAIMYGAKLLKYGYAQKAIVGGVDSLAKFTINGFNSLNILSNDVCKPFDAQRNGLNLGEAAAFMVLQKEGDCQNKRVYAELSGWANVNDSFHPASLSERGEGAHIAMKQALQAARLLPQQISFINTHGTGTENNDLAESYAMISVFDKVPPFASAKSNIGHTLGAAGAVEAVFCIFNLVYQEWYASLHFQEPMPETGLIPVVKYSQSVIHHVMSNSFGFGGNCCSLIFSKV